MKDSVTIGYSAKQSKDDIYVRTLQDQLEQGLEHSKGYNGIQNKKLVVKAQAAGDYSKLGSGHGPWPRIPPRGPAATAHGAGTH